MKSKNKLISAMLTIVLLCSLCLSSAFAAQPEQTDLTAKEVQILFTHDMHSHLDSYKINKNGSLETVGGFAKLKTMAEEKRAAIPATFLVDGGDFAMGTLYQTIYETDAPELTLMGEIGYDATTFGNHEFDYRSKGICNMLLAAVSHAKETPGLQLPALVSANIDWSKNTSEANLLIKSAMETYGSTPYTVVERGGVRVGIYGGLGEDADACAPESGFVFEDIVETSKKIVQELKKENVDMIVCLSHSGTFEDKEKSEDEILAQEVPEIDIIVSGHTHTRLDAPIQYGDTYVVSAGSYCENLGELLFTQREDGRWNLDKYVLNPLDKTVAEDEAIQTQLAQYKQIVNDRYLSQFGYSFDQVLAENPVAFTQMSDFALEHREDPLGSLIADSYVYAVQQAEGEDYEKVDVSISPIMTTAQLYPSGLRWTYNPNRLLLNRVTDVEFVTNIPYTNGQERTPVEDDKLYRVVAGLYSAQMLGTIEDTSMGLLKLAPKDKDGNVITDFESCIIHDQNGTEVKEWYALASYLESFDTNENKVPEIPTYYAAAEGRKQLDDSHNIIDLLKNPNKFAWMLYGVILLLILLVVGIVRFIQKRRKRKNIVKKQKL